MSVMSKVFGIVCFLPATKVQPYWTSHSDTASLGMDLWLILLRSKTKATESSARDAGRGSVPRTARPTCFYLAAGQCPPSEGSLQFCSLGALNLMLNIQFGPN